MDQQHARSYAAGREITDDLVKEIARQDKIHPAGYPATRDGVRFGICTAADELREARDAWRDERSDPDWKATEAELIQAAAVAMRAVRSIRLARKYPVDDPELAGALAHLKIRLDADPMPDGVIYLHDPATGKQFAAVIVPEMADRLEGWDPDHHGHLDPT